MRENATQLLSKTVPATHASDTSEPLLCFSIVGIDDFDIHEVSGDDLVCVNQHYRSARAATNHKEIRTSTVEGTATLLLRQIRLIQPRGPFRVTGTGVFGILACEVVAQLLGEDEAVEFLGLIDLPDSDTSDRGKGAHHGTMSLLSPSFGQRVDVLTPPLLRKLMQTFAGKLRDSLIHIVSTNPASAAGSAVKGEHGHELWPRWCSEGVCRPASWTELSLSEYPLLLSRVLAKKIKQAQNVLSAPPETTDSLHVIIQQGSRGRRPVFCVPGAGDNGAVFTPLCAALGRDYPVYALQARGLDGRLNPHTSVEAAANRCIRAIDSLQPTWPIHLIGHSFGAWIAFEVARYLLKHGRTIASLTLIDSEPPQLIHEIREFTELDVYRRLIELLELSAGRSLGISSSELVAAADPDRNLSLLHRGVVRAGLMSSRTNSKTLAGPVNTFAAALRTSYVPNGTFDERVSLALVDDPRLSTHENVNLQRETVLAWQRFAPRAAAWLGPGNHFSVLRPPHVARLAEWWRHTSENA